MNTIECVGCGGRFPEIDGPVHLEHGLSAENANDAMLEATKRKRTFVWLEPPVGPACGRSEIRPVMSRF